MFWYVEPEPDEGVVAAGVLVGASVAGVVATGVAVGASVAGTVVLGTVVAGTVVTGVAVVGVGVTPVLPFCVVYVSAEPSVTPPWS